MNIKNNQVTISGAVAFKDGRGKRQFLLVKMGNEDKWEFPKVTVRRGESSVRASLRMTGEMAGMNARILEEAGRGSGSVLVNGKSVPQKYYYYLMLQKSGGEVLGFADYKWMEYVKAKSALALKREKDILVQAKDILKEWEKTHKIKFY